MTRTSIEAAEAAAERFLDLAAVIEYAPQEKANPWIGECIRSSPKLTGELRRASLDLTRRLAEMRKP